MRRKRLLWNGDAGAATGFEKATRHTCDVLQKTFDVVVLGINFVGDPGHGYAYPVFPCRSWGFADPMGSDRLPALCRELEIDIIVLQNDVWNIPKYVKKLREAGLETPVIAALAVDGKNCQGKDLDGIAHAVFWTEFAQREAELGGYAGPSTVIPLGVDLNVFKLGSLDDAPAIREHARKMFARNANNDTLDIDAFRSGFVVGCVNRNQTRKRLDLLVEYFCTWVKRHDVPDAFLAVHACPTGEQEYDVEQLMAYWGCPERLFLLYPDAGRGSTEANVAWFMRACDVLASTTQGEGFGLPTFESMALGVPSIVPDYAALGELCNESSFLVPCTSHAATQKKINVIGGIADRETYIDGLDLLYRSKELRLDLSRRGLALVSEPRFRWENIGQRFTEVVNAVLSHPTTVKEVEEFWTDIGRSDEVASAR